MDDILNMEAKAVGGSSDLPIAPKDHQWDGPAAKKRIFEYAGGDKFSPAKARKGFFFYDEAKENEKTAYKLPFADVIDGKLMAVPRALKAVQGALHGARGTGVDIPAEDKDRIQKKLNAYKKRMGEDTKEPKKGEKE